MAEESSGVELRRELGFKPGVTPAEYEAKSSKAFQEALVSSGFSPAIQERLTTFFNQAQEAFIKDSQVNQTGRKVLRRGLRLARLKERGVDKDRLYQERTSLKRTCGDLIKALDPHLPEVPSQKDLTEAAVQLALAVQRLKKSSEETGREKIQDEDLKRRLVKEVLKTYPGRAKLTVPIGLAVAVALALSTMILVQEFRGGRMPRQEIPSPAVVRQLKQEDLGKLVGFIPSLQRGEGLPRGPSEVAQYFQGVYGIDVQEELGKWLTTNPGASEEEQRRFVEKLLAEKAPTFTGGYSEWQAVGGGIREFDYTRLKDLGEELRLGRANPMLNPEFDLWTYYQEVYGVNVLEEMEKWVEVHPEGSKEEFEKFLEQLLVDKKPVYIKGYGQWHQEIWLPRQKTPTPESRLLKGFGRRGFQSERAKVSARRGTSHHPRG